MMTQGVPKLCSPSAQVCLGSIQVRSGSAQVCSPLAQVKAAAAHVQRLKREPAKEKVEYDSGGSYKLRERGAGKDLARCTKYSVIGTKTVPRFAA
jgi:hypothetical protein